MVWEGELDYKQRGGAGGNMVWEGVLDYCTIREEEQVGLLCGRENWTTTNI